MNSFTAPFQGFWRDFKLFAVAFKNFQNTYLSEELSHVAFTILSLYGHLFVLNAVHCQGNGNIRKWDQKVNKVKKKKNHWNYK